MNKHIIFFFCLVFSLSNALYGADNKLNISETTEKILLQIEKENVVEHKFNPNYQNIIDVLNTYNNYFTKTRFNLTTSITNEVNSNMFCGSADTPGKNIKESIFGKKENVYDEIYTNVFNKYSNISEKHRSCFCLYDVNRYTDLSDECILARREAKDSDIGYFDFKQHLQEYLPNISKDDFKKLAEQQSMVDSYRVANCIDNYDLTSFEMKECVNYTHIFMEKLIYNTLTPCKHKYAESKNPKIEETIKGWIDVYPEIASQEKLIRERYRKQDIIKYEIENNCSFK